MSRPLRTFLRTGLPFGLFMAFYHGVMTGLRAGPRAGIIAGFLGGLIGGALFGLIMAAFANSTWVRRSARPAFAAGERIVRDTPANHFVGLEAVGGWLFLTDQRLVFKSHPFNLQRHELSVGLHQIEGTEFVRTLGAVPNSLVVRTADGRREQFVVDDREQWAAALKA